MDKKTAPVGGSSLLAIFGVLCLTVFALLSLATVRADMRLSEGSANAVIDYYAADCAAEEILSRLLAGELPDGVTEETDGSYSYSCPISDMQSLQVSVMLYPDGSYQILRWQAVAAGWEEDDGLDVWDGGFDGDEGLNLWDGSSGNGENSDPRDGSLDDDGEINL